APPPHGQAADLPQNPGRVPNLPRWASAGDPPATDAKFLGLVRVVRSRFGRMSYLVLARKYRPQRFDELVGQEHIARTLTNAIAGKRVHHAFLFTGARGVGK